MGFRIESLKTGRAAGRDPAKGRIVALLLLLAIAAAGLLLRGSGGGETLIDGGDARLVAKGQAIYTQHCAACHGRSLEGQPDWRQRRADGRLPAPPHDASGHTWHHPDQMLIGMVSEGFQTGRYAPPGYSSDMPAYANVLSEEEIVAVLAFIKSTWPERERAHQQRITQQAAN